MPGYDTWEDERERLLNAVGAPDHDRIEKLVDGAAEAARASTLREAARCLEEARQIMVGNRLFQGWDDGIWVFSSIIKIIRRTSREDPPPPEYQRFLDAIPSARMDVEMTPEQKEFWYGSRTAQVGGVIQIVPGSGGKSTGCLTPVVVVLALAVVVCG